MNLIKKSKQKKIRMLNQRFEVNIIIIPFSIVRFVPTKLNKRMKKIDYEIGNVLRGIIQKQEGIMKTCEASNDNLLGLLLESNQKEIEDQEGLKKDVGMNTNDVIKECKLFYFAGQETTSVLLNWTMVLLSRFPKWQTLAREEVIEIFGTKEPDYDGLSRLKVVSITFQNKSLSF